MNTLEFEGQIRERRRELDRLSGEARALAARHTTVRQEAEELKVKVAVLEKVSGVLTSIGDERQKKTQDTIEQLVTMGLRTIFGPELSFHLVQRIANNRAQVEFIVRSQYGDETVDTPCLEARGGGLVSVIGFLLRVVVLLLKKEKNQLLVLDEVFSMLSSEYLPAASQFLKELTQKTGVQILLVTHQIELMEDADVTYSFSLSDAGHTVVKKL